METGSSVGICQGGGHGTTAIPARFRPHSKSEEVEGLEEISRLFSKVKSTDLRRQLKEPDER